MYYLSETSVLGLSSPNIPWRVRACVCKPFKRMAGSTGLEPAASAVTGQRSNQLNYDPAFAVGDIHRRCPASGRITV